MSRSASHNDDQPEPEPAPDKAKAPRKRKPAARKAEDAGTRPKPASRPTPRPASNGRKSAPVGPIPTAMPDLDFDSAAEQSLADPSADVDDQGLDDLDVTERFDLGE